MIGISNISGCVGNNLNFAITDTNGSVLMNSNELPQNTLFISAPQNEAGMDNGIYSIFITDSNNNIARLSYTIIPGNGLILDKVNSDVLYFNIDNNTLVEKNNKLDINLNNIIDNNTIVNKKGKLSVTINNLPIATVDKAGVVSIDDDTIKYNNEEFYVNVNELTKATNTSPGIIKGDSNTIVINNGVISVNTNNLNKSTENKHGIIAIDNRTITAVCGVIGIKTENIKLTSEYDYGISQPDNNTIILNNNNQYEVGNLPYASQTTYGVVKTNNTIDSKCGVIGVHNYNFFKESIVTLKNKIDEYNNIINKLEQHKLTLSTDKTIKTPTIFTFVCNGPTTTILDKRNDNKNEFSCEFIVNTNADFVISIKTDSSNVNPQIELKSIEYDEYKYINTTGISKTYASTEYIDKPLKFIFIARNFNNESDAAPETITTSVKIELSLADHTNIHQEITYSFIRYNMAYDKRKLIGNVGKFKLSNK